jgi:hypothetical protein
MPMQTVITAKEATPTKGKLHLFSLYTDFPASVRARWAAATIIKMAGRQWQSSSEMWKLDSLAVSQPIKDMLSNDAANADVIFIAVSSLEQRAPELVQWLHSLAAREPGRSVPGVLIALLGDEADQSRELDWTVKQLIRCAQQTDRNFIWHWMEKGAMDDSNWLTDSVEELFMRHWVEKGVMHDSGWLTESVEELLTRKSAANREAILR